MKISVGTRLGAIALALALLLGYMPISAGAVSICADGTHQPGSTLYPADWNDQTGGYGNDYYLCTVCGEACDADGYLEVHVGPGNGCSGGQKCHVLGTPYSTACAGTFSGTLYYCAGCNQIVDADGTIADLSVLTGHTPGTTQEPADYTPCYGGYQSPYYVCTVCGLPTDANGTGAVWSASTGHVADTSTLYPADWNDQTGGYGYDYYKCINCGWGCDEHGHPHVFVDAANGCSGGYKRHVPGAVEYGPDYTPCQGGYKVPYYRCTACNSAVDSDGTLVTWYAPTHTPGSELHEANYTPCGGGFTSDFYECIYCHCPVDENGAPLEYSEPTTNHVLGEKQPADYTPCQGGFKVDFYICAVCGQPVTEDGGSPEWFEPTGSHTPGDELHEANYTACGGGFTSDFYECIYCHCP
ncbi:MAG: hypothetical protein ACI4O3_04775, partial [Oscillospiraceae bacterium]